MTSIDRLEAAFGVVLDEARKNAAFRERLEGALSGTFAEPGGATRRHRREPASIDPFKIFDSDGETGLRDVLGKLDLEQLKNVISGYDMDRDRLALKWRSPERLIDRIVETVAARRRKGDAFLGEPAGGGSRVGKTTEP
jgi:hypothetical protein